MPILPMIMSSGGGATITITYTEDFYNQTITCSHGTKSYSKVATSSGSVEFNVDEEGTWEISCVIDGQPYTTTVDIDLSGEGTLSKGVNGKTVLPTDDIDTWIKCAGLQNTNNYSTLAEVLADTELFDTLLRDSNACDYMARSTTWALAEGLVPILSADDNKVVSSSAYSGCEKWKAFDGDEDSYFMATSGAGLNDFYLGYDFTNQNIRKVTIKACSTSSGYGYGYNVAIYGSDDLSTFTKISDEQEVLATYGNPVFLKFDIDTSVQYKYCILKIVSSSASYATYGTTYGLRIYTLQFYADVDITTNQSAMQRIGRYNYCSDTLLNNEVWCEAIAESEYVDEILDVKVPTMTDGTHPSGEVIGSSTYQTNYLYYVFDGSTSTKWHSTQGMPQYIGYKFTEPVVVKCVKLRSHADAPSVKTSKLQGSNDGFVNDVHDIGNFVDCPNPATWYSKSFDNSTAYQYYRLYITDSNYASGQYVMIGELQFYGRHESNKYTPLVPKMTSDTTPSGTVSYSSQQSGYEGYKAFNQVVNNSWSATGFTNQWLQYDFGIAKSCDGAMLRALNIGSGGKSRVKEYKIQGSNDGTTFVELTEILTCPQAQDTSYGNASALQTIPFTKNLGNYRYYRAYVLNGWESNIYIGIETLQFYSLVPPAKQIHSCPNDTIYIMREGSPVTVATTDLDGIGELDWADFDDGELTLYSSVAKDFANLSDDYSKVCRITKTQYGHTTDFYLMPEKTLYWHGYISKNLESCTSANGWSDRDHSTIALQSPTYNTNDVYIASTGTTATQGMGTKTVVDLTDYTSVKAICTTTAQGTGNKLEVSPNKQIREAYQYTGLAIALVRDGVLDNGYRKVTCDVTNVNQNAIIDLNSGYGGSTMSCFALWLE